MTVGALCIAVVSIGWALWTRRAESSLVRPSVARFSIPALTSGIVSGNTIAVSPDGSKIVYVARDPVLPRVYLALRPLDTEGITELPGTEDAAAPFFSPDGESIAFAKGSRLMRLDLSGGAARTIVDLGNSVGPLAGGAAPFGGAWGKDGTIIFSTGSGRVFRVPSSGGQATRLARLDSAVYRQFAWLPDGRRLLATRVVRLGAQVEVVVISAETGELLATVVPGVTLQFVHTGELAYIASDGTLKSARFDPRSLKITGTPTMVITTGATAFAYFARALPIAVSQSGTVAYVSSLFGDFADKEMVIVTPGAQPKPLPLGKRAFRGPRFSPDGKQIAVDVEPGGDLVGDVWLFDRAASTFSRLTFEGTSIFPEWTPDGSALLYSAVDTAGSRNLYRVPADRSAPPSLLVHAAWPIFESAPSPNDGPLFYRLMADATTRDIYVLPKGGKPTAFAASPFQERTPAVSPDGRLILYASNETGGDQVYLRRVDGAGRTQVSASGGSEPRWAPGGREVLYWNGDTLFAVPVSPATLSVGARRSVLVGAFAREPFHSNYDVAPDGKTFVMIRSSSPVMSINLTVLMNWFDAEHRTPGK